MNDIFSSRKMFATLFLISLFMSIGFSLEWCNIPGECTYLNSCRTKLTITTFGENNISTNFTQLLNSCGKQSDLELNSIRIIYQNETSSILIPVNYSNTTNVTEVYFNATEIVIGNGTYYMYFSPVKNLILNYGFETNDFSNWENTSVYNACNHYLAIESPSYFGFGNYNGRVQESCGGSKGNGEKSEIKSTKGLVGSDIKKVVVHYSYYLQGNGGSTLVIKLFDENNASDKLTILSKSIYSGSQSEILKKIEVTDWAKGKEIYMKVSIDAPGMSYGLSYVDDLKINIHNKTEPSLTFIRTLITPPYSTVGATEDFPSLSIDFQNYAKMEDVIPIKIKNNGKARSYDLQIFSENGEVNQTTIEKLESNEEKIINFEGNLEVGVYNLTISINHDNQKNIVKTQQLIIYSEETTPEETSSVTFNDSGIYRYLTKNANYTFTNNLTEELNLSEAIIFESEFTSSECRDLANNLLNTQTLADKIIVNIGNLAVGTTKKIKCDFESTNAISISEEMEEEQDLTRQSNTTFAFTRIPLFFNNPYSINLTINWEYNKTGVNNRTKSETSGMFTLINKTTEIRYLEMNKTINLTLIKIQNHTNGKINPENNYLETYGLFVINNDENISFSNIFFEYKNSTYFENITGKIEANNNTVTENYLPVKLAINKLETEIGALEGFDYSLNRKIKMNHNNDFNIYNLTFEYTKGNWEVFKVYKCIYDNASKCIISNSSNWEIKEYQEEAGKIKVKNNSMSDLVYIISYKIKTPPPEDRKGSGGGGGIPIPFEIYMETQIENTNLFIKVNSTKYTSCNYSLNENEFEKMEGEKKNWNKTIKLEPGIYNLSTKCTYGLETLYENKTITIENQYNNNSITPETTQENEELIEDEPVIETAGITGLSIGSGNFWLGIIVLFIALTGFYIYQKRESIPEIKAPKITLPKIKKPKVKLPRIKKPKINLRKPKLVKKIKPIMIEKQENLPVVLSNKKNNINRKEIEDATNLDKPLGVQRICQFIKKDGKKLNYTITELANLLNLSQVSVRTAVNRGLKLGVFEKYEHGKFKAYRLGKYGGKIAELETEIKTYSELETVISLIKKRK